MSAEPLPPHLHQFAHPLGETVWAAIEKLDVGTKQWLQERLDEHLAASLVTADKPGRHQRAIRALRRAKRQLGHSPSVNEYRRLRDETHDPELVPDSSIRSALASGSWNDALALAGLSRLEEDVRIPVRVSRSPLKYTEAECVAALRACRDDLGSVPSLTMYERWVRRSDVRARPGRRPLSDGPFWGLFGSYSRALAAAGVVSDEVQAVKQDSFGVRPAKYAYTDEDFLSALREVHDRLGRVPRMRPYDRERQKIIEESFAAGTPRTLSSYAAFLKRFGGWNEALGAAGMQPYEGRWDLGEFEPPQMSGNCDWTDEELLAFVREACAACRGADTSQEEYIVWRRREMRRAEWRGTPRRVPAKTTINTRFGGWTRTMRRLFPKE